MSNINHWTSIGRHEVVPEVKHDEAARLTVISHLNAFLSGQVAPTVKADYDANVVPEFTAANGRAPADRHEVREAMESRTSYQLWSTLRRNTMEMRQQTGRSIVLRQAAELAEKAAAVSNNAATLKLNPALEIPEYVAVGDQHLMPGGYAGELIDGDVSGAANYDIGLFATLGGGAGPWNNLAGRTLVSWMQKTHPDFQPKRILDLGCGMGHNTLPLRDVFPDAEIVAVDVAAPMLRYGHARAQSLGVNDVQFIQADANDTGFEDGSFDLVFTTMVLHETSAEAVAKLFSECQRLLRDGGLTVHLEQPPYRRFDVYEQFMRDWDGRNNNEPFWSKLHELSLPEELVAAGFDAGTVFEDNAIADGFEEAGEEEDFGRAPNWYVVGARLGRKTGGVKLELAR